MLYDSILTQTAEYKKFLGQDEEFMRPNFAPIETINCRWEGYTRNYPAGNRMISYNARKYITLVEIAVKDILDGQVVIAVNPISGFNGQVSHYESLVGDFKE